jgi:NADH-quinone oxidoreductase subunit M
VAVVGVILAALYLLWAYQRVFHGEPDEANADTPDLNWADGLVLAPLLAAIVFLGVYPKPVLERIEPSVNRLIAHIEDRTDYRQPEVGVRGPAAVQTESGDATTEEHK